MPRMHGERQQDFWLRQQTEAQSREVTRRWEVSPRLTVELPIACRCAMRTYAHTHDPMETFTTLRRRQLDPAKYMSAPPPSQR